MDFWGGGRGGLGHGVKRKEVLRKEERRILGLDSAFGFQLSAWVVGSWSVDD